jgi:hypothetical protein
MEKWLVRITIFALLAATVLACHTFTNDPRYTRSGLLDIPVAYAAEILPDDLPVLPYKVSLDRIQGSKCVGVIQVAGSKKGYHAFPDQFTVTEFAKTIDPRTEVIVDINHGACYPAAEVDAFDNNVIYNRYQAACLGPLKQCTVINLVVDEDGSPTVKENAPGGNLMPPPLPAATAPKVEPIFRP